MAGKLPIRSAIIHGFSLIEVMVALFVLAVGMLGVNALQIQALQENSDNYWRAQAVILSQDLADRMRANTVGAAKGSYRTTGGATPGGNCVTGTCTPAQIAGWDLLIWNTAITNAGLPAGQGTVICADATGTADGLPCSPGPASLHTVTVTWTAAAAENVTISFRL